MRRAGEFIPVWTKARGMLTMPTAAEKQTTGRAVALLVSNRIYRPAFRSASVAEIISAATQPIA
jgi:hypothetical protein